MSHRISFFYIQAFNLALLAVLNLACQSTTVPNSKAHSQNQNPVAGLSEQLEADLVHALFFEEEKYGDLQIDTASLHSVNSTINYTMSANTNVAGAHGILVIANKNKLSNSKKFDPIDQQYYVISPFQLSTDSAPNGNLHVISSANPQEVLLYGALVVDGNIFTTKLPVEFSVVQPNDHPTLIPGDSTTGANLSGKLQVIGSGKGVDAKAFIRLNVVPKQDVSNSFQIGVLAFHMNGIERVEFSLNGGPWVAVYQSSFNTRTKVDEYWSILDPTSLQEEGPITIDAIAFPKVGTPRHVATQLYALPLGHDPQQQVRWVSPSGNDSNTGTQNSPKKTIVAAVKSIQQESGNVEGAIVYLFAGEYAYGPVDIDAKAENRWLTITAAPGVVKEAVRLVSKTIPGLHCKQVHIKNITTRVPFGSSGKVCPSGGTCNKEDKVPRDSIWLDNVLALGNGPHTPSDPSKPDKAGSTWFPNHWKEKYVTESEARDFPFCIGADVTLVRNSHCENIGMEAFRNTSVVINSSINKLSRGPQTTWHPDVHQFNINNIDDENNIFYGVRATDIDSQMIFVSKPKTTELAVINSLYEKTSNDGSKSQWHTPSNHLIMWNVTHVGSGFTWRIKKEEIKNVSIQGSVFQTMGYNAPSTGPDPNWFDINHFIDTPDITVGGDVSFGDAGFIDNYYANNPQAFEPASGSVLNDRMFPNIPTDINGNERKTCNPTCASIGAYE